ncbi:MAG TPA: serine/threonine-protein kinase [Polyangiaceae bacterium]|nr:serine/threonine-protein kinase [Polyangiaceae bacterium]
MMWYEQLLEDNYALERVIGCGGAGIVLAARHRRLGQRVALKFLRPDRPRAPEVLERLVLEAQITARIKSAHVTRMLDIGRLPDGEPFLVMEYLEGCDLAALLKARGPLASSDAVAYLRQACAGLTASHAMGIIHRDLKPSNLFLSLAPNGSPLVKILDFGSAEESPRPGTVAGTHERARKPLDMGSPPFAAPEQLRAERPADPKSDIWALGAALFTLLAGRSPFARPYLSETYLAILSGRVPNLTAARPDIERSLAAVVERCLAADPEQRFASAAELSVALEPFVTQAPKAAVSRAAPARPARSKINVHRVAELAHR